MEPTPKELRIYQEESGSKPFSEWLNKLRDVKGRALIRNRLGRLENGNFGDCEPVGRGVHELRIDFGPGYRVYFGRDSGLVILLGGGDKTTQEKDIRRAKERWEEYNA